jgi:hypothetical protein
MKTYRFLFFALLIYAPIGWTQCAPGIPGAGNPGCIPPTAPGSPYAQPGGDVAPIPSQPAAVWEERWGAIAMDYGNGAAGGVKDGATKQDATRRAIERCTGSGGTQCELTIAFENQCVAVAQKSVSGAISTATAADSTEATARVLQRCGDGTVCKVVYEFCVRPVRVK